MKLDILTVYGDTEGCMEFFKPVSVNTIKSLSFIIFIISGLYFLLFDRSYGGVFFIAFSLDVMTNVVNVIYLHYKVVAAKDSKELSEAQNKLRRNLISFLPYMLAPLYFIGLAFLSQQ